MTLTHLHMDQDGTPLHRPQYPATHHHHLETGIEIGTGRVAEVDPVLIG